MGKTGVNHWWSNGLHKEARMQQAADTSMHLDEDGWRGLCGALNPGDRFTLHEKRKEPEGDFVGALRLVGVYPHHALFEITALSGVYRVSYGWHELALLRMTGKLKQKSRNE